MGGRERVPGFCAPSHFGKGEKKTILIRGDSGDSVCVFTFSSLPPPPHIPRLLYPWENWGTRYHCNYRKCSLLGGWGRGGVWEALLEKTFIFSLRFYFILFFLSFGKGALCSRPVRVKIRFRLQASPWLFPFLSEFLPTCNLLNEILRFCLTGIFFADVGLT